MCRWLSEDVRDGLVAAVARVYFCSLHAAAVVCGLMKGAPDSAASAGHGA